VLLAMVDGLARVRRRRHPIARWLMWVAAAVLPFALAAAFVATLRLTGLLDTAPPSPVAPGVIPLDGAAVGILAGAGALFLLGWLMRPFLLGAFHLRGRELDPGTSAATLTVLVAAVVAAWIVNPFLAALLLPALHIGMLMVAPEVRLGRLAVVALAA